MESLLKLDDIGIPTDSSSAYKSFALQVHYKTKSNFPDRSGVTMKLQAREHMKHHLKVDVYIPNQWFTLRPHQERITVKDTQTYLMKDNFHIHFFRVHAHHHGIENELRIARKGYGEIATIKRSVLLPQSFVPLDEPIVLKRGDQVTVTCFYQTMKENKVVRECATKECEMCNFYILGYVADPKDDDDDNIKNNHSSIANQVKKKLVFPKFNQNIPWTKSASNLSIQNANPINQFSGTQIVSATVSAENHVYILSRGARIWDGLSFDFQDRFRQRNNPIPEKTVTVVHGESGELIASWGEKQLFLPHSISMDPSGKAVWITDVGMHQALKFSLNGTLLSTIGTRLEPGNGKDKFCKPTDVAILNSKIYVSDGYCNDRVVVFDYKTQKYLFEWGHSGSKDGEFQFASWAYNRENQWQRCPFCCRSNEFKSTNV